VDTLDPYREAIRKVIDEYARYPVSHGDIATEVIVDREKDHYELVHVGWDGPRRVHGAVIHIDIIDGRVWIQHDGTESGVAEELVQAGVPRDAIVLGFRPPHVRQYSGFAVA
jgi:hypothetical protein